MAITEKDYLLVERAGNTYMLLKSPTRFHLVRTDGLSVNRKNRLMRLYPCGNDMLKAMEIHFSAFRSESLRRVVLTGGKRGDFLQFWAGTSVQEYTLRKDYSEDELNGFFCAQQRTWRRAPKWEGLPPELIRRITWWTNGLSIACSVWFWLFAVPYRLMAAACILCHIISIILVAACPESFTLLESAERHKHKRQQRGCLLAAFAAPGFALALRALTDFTYPGNESFWQLALAAFAIWIPVAALLILKATQLRENMPEFIALLVMLLFLNLGTAGHLNYLLDFDMPQCHTLEVVDKHVDSGSKSTSYYVTVIFPDGEELELSVSGGKYRDVAVGERVLVKEWDGAFGIHFYTTNIISD